MAKRSTFLRNGRGVFKCATCDRSCRQTSETGDSECCTFCYELAGYENQFSDEGTLGDSDKRQIANLVVGCVKAGGSRDKMVVSFELGDALR